MREVRIGMLGAGFIGEFHAQGLRYVPDARVTVHADADAGARAAFAERFGSRGRRLARGPVRRPRGRPRRRLAAQPVPPARRSGARRRPARRSPAPSRSAATPTEAARDAPRSSRDAGVFNAYLENVIFNPDMLRMREMVEPGAIGRLTTFRAREGHSGPARGALLGRRARRGRRAARHGVARHRGGPLLLRQGPRVRRRLRLGRHPRPRRADHRRGQRGHDHPLRRRACRDVRRVVVVEGRAGGPLRGLRRRRAADRGHRRRLAQGVRRAAGRLRRARRPTPRRAGSSRCPTRSASTATT